MSLRMCVISSCDGLYISHEKSVPRILLSLRFKVLLFILFIEGIRSRREKQTIYTTSNLFKIADLQSEAEITCPGDYFL